MCQKDLPNSLPIRLAHLTTAVVVFLAGLLQSASCPVSESPRAIPENRAPAIEFMRKITPEEPAELIFMKLKFLSEKNLLAMSYHGAVGIWDVQTGFREKLLSPRDKSQLLYGIPYVTADGKLAASRIFRRTGKGWDLFFQLLDLSEGRRFTILGPRMQGDAPHHYITRDKKTFWATSSINPLSAGAYKTRWAISETDPLSLELQQQKKTSLWDYPRYHCGTENLLLLFRQLTNGEGLNIEVWDLEQSASLNQPGRRLVLKGHSSESFWRIRTEMRIPPQRSDRYTGLAYKTYATLHDPIRNKLYLLLPYSEKPLGKASGMHLTVISTGGILKEEASFTLPSLTIKAMALHPEWPILFCVTGNDKIFLVDTVLKKLVGKVLLRAQAFERDDIEGNLIAISPTGRLLAIANQDGTISIFEISK